jgi:hypothetical protein
MSSALPRVLVSTSASTSILQDSKLWESWNKSLILN